MIETMNQDMHADHRAWLSHLSLWQDDLDAWRKELRRATDDLRQAERVLEAHARALDQHTLDLTREEGEILAHERTLARPGLPGRQDFGRRTAAHVTEADHHIQLQDAHERLKAYHHIVMARVAQLARALAEPV
jgi:hypothetical protein